MTESQANQHFIGLILSLHSSAWIHLGKVSNPATGKTERNLEAASAVIDLLGALDEKTRGNRVADEDKLMAQILTELRMNYVDELERSKAEPADAGAESGAATDTASPESDSGAAGTDTADTTATNTASAEEAANKKAD